MNVAERLANAADRFERHRARLAALSVSAAELAQIDVIVVDGERAVLAKLDELLDRARELLSALAVDADNRIVLERLEACLAPDPWSVLDEVERLLTFKTGIAQNARAELQQRLDLWTPIFRQVKKLVAELKDRYPHVVERPDLARSRKRMRALHRQASRGLVSNQLLDVRRALEALESSNSTRRGPAPRDVPARLQDIIDHARASAGRVQLIVLRGPLDKASNEYTLILLTMTGDG